MGNRNKASKSRQQRGSQRHEESTGGWPLCPGNLCQATRMPPVLRELVSDIVASCKAWGWGGVGDGTQLELPDLAKKDKKNTGFPVKFQFLDKQRIRFLV